MSDSSLSEEDMLIAAALAAGQKVTAIASKLGISTRTVYRRKKDPALRALVAELRGAMVDSAVGKLSAVAERAASTLAKLLTADSEGVRLQAANSVLSQLLKAHESVEFAERLAALENRPQAPPPHLAVYPNDEEDIPA